jgi:hypothetical protein
MIAIKNDSKLLPSNMRERHFFYIKTSAERHRLHRLLCAKIVLAHIAYCTV